MSVKTYISKYKNYAVTEMKRAGIPASITLAQGILESASGNSYLARKGSNHFGIKCHRSWQGKRLYAKDDKRRDCFRYYRSPYRSFVDHSNFLRNNSRYHSLFKKKITDYKGWARGLRKAGYATNKSYDRSLIKVIQRFGLHKYDKLHKGKLPAPPKNTTSKKKKKKRKKGKKKTADANKISVKNIKPTSYNGLEALKFRDDMPLKSIEKGYKVAMDQLLKYNNFEKGQTIPANTYIFLQPLKGQAPVGINRHKVRKGESLKTISQKYGVQLRSLYRFNKMKWGNEPIVGEYIYLRTMAKKTPKLKDKKAVKAKEVKATKKSKKSAKKVKAIKPIDKKTTAKSKQQAKKTLKKVTVPKEKTANSKKTKDLAYVVKSKETLYSIARKYNIDVKTLKKQNKIKKNLIKPGQKLFIKR